MMYVTILSIIKLEFTLVW